MENVAEIDQQKPKLIFRGAGRDLLCIEEAVHISRDLFFSTPTRPLHTPPPPHSQEAVREQEN